MSAVALTYRSELAAPVADVWASVTSMAGINRETMPVFRMTGPADFASLADASFSPGVPLFRSRILAFGFVPIDWSDLTLVSLDPGRGFVERSAMGSMRSWEHIRQVEPMPSGCAVIDQLSFVPRLPRAISRAMINLAFRNRHRNLRRLFGSMDASL
jgi:ligand-binding SRPBCC domain-containing protein